MEIQTKIASIPIFKCLQCGHEWIARVDIPKACPACKSYSWNKKTTEKGKSKS